MMVRYNTPEHTLYVTRQFAGALLNSFLSGKIMD